MAVQSPTRAGVQLVIERFPNVQKEVQSLFERHGGFRELCDEYRACVEAVQRLAASRPEQDPMRREYECLKLRLEAEMLRELRDAGS